MLFETYKGDIVVTNKTKIKAYFAFVLLFSFSLSLNAKSIASEDSDGDGLADSYEEQIGTEAYLFDTDGDGVSDGVEVGKNQKKPQDTDKDGRIDALDYDDDNDGLPTFLEGKADTDKDGKKDYLDTDADNDGVNDGVEAGMLAQDKNYDGIDDAFDAQRKGAVDNNGDGIDDNLKLADHNKDGVPDYLDSNYVNDAKTKQLAKSDNKKITKAVSRPEKIKNTQSVILVKEVAKPSSLAGANPLVKKEQAKPVISRYTDTDNDGLLDTLEKSLGTNPLKRDSDGDTVSDAIEIGIDINTPLDSDHDGTIDALDTDDDNDGILTRLEDLNKDGSAINDDTDEDGVPNYLDGNDDGDNRLTINEGGAKKDTDKDGIPDYLDKNDGVKDVVPHVAKKTNETDKPEVIVLFDGNVESLPEPAEFDNDTQVSETSDILEKSINQATVNTKPDSVSVNESSGADNTVRLEQHKEPEKKQASQKVATKSPWQLF